MEIICAESESRYVLFPIKYDKVFELYKKQLASFWTVEEIDISKDIGFTIDSDKTMIPFPGN